MPFTRACVASHLPHSNDPSPGAAFEYNELSMSACSPIDTC